MTQPTQSITPEQLTATGTAVFEGIIRSLPPRLGARLKPARKAWRHGTRNSVLIWSFWDRNQLSGVVDHRYFQYELVYDPGHFYSRGTDWYVELYINPNRIYHHGAEVASAILPPLRRRCPPRFQVMDEANWFGLIQRFNFPRPLAELAPHVTPLFVELVEQTHPIVQPFIDSFHEPLTPEERAAFILGRAPNRPKNTTAPANASTRELSRAIPPALRSAVLKAYQHRCASCLRTAEDLGAALEIDHVRPVAEGGLTRPDNLQPLCTECHDAKGPGTVRYPVPRAS